MLWYYYSSSVKHLPDNKVQVAVKEALFSKEKQGESVHDVAICQSLNEAYKDVKGEYSYGVRIDEFNCTTYETRTISKTYYGENGNILCKEDSTGGGMGETQFKRKKLSTNADISGSL